MFNASYRSPRDDVTSHYLHTLTTNHKKLHISDYTIIKMAQSKIQPFLHILDKGISHILFAQGILIHAQIIIFTHNAGFHNVFLGCNLENREELLLVIEAKNCFVYDVKCKLVSATRPHVVAKTIVSLDFL